MKFLERRMFLFILGWLKENRASAAVEFSLLAIPFFLLTLAIIEISLMYASATLLEGATGSAARLIRTGQAQQSIETTPEAMFQSALCDYTTVLIDCNDVVIEAQEMSSFTDFDSMQAQYDEDGNLESQGFNVGGSGDRVLIRTSYRYSMITPVIGQILSGPNGSILFMSTIVLQTEPYDAVFN